MSADVPGLDPDPQPVATPAPPRPASSGSVWAVIAIAFMAMMVLSGLVAAAVLAQAVFAGELSMEALGGPESVALTSQPSFLLPTVTLTSVFLLAIALLASGYPKPSDGATEGLLTRRLRLRRFSPLDALVASLGTAGVGGALGAALALLGLDELGSLGIIETALSELDGPRLLGAALILGLGPGFAEEFLFRGYMLRKMAFIDGTKSALIASTIAFGLFHADPVHTPTAAIIGLYLGMCVLRTGSLWVGVLAHAFNNTVATLLTPYEMGPAEYAAVLVLGSMTGLFAYRFLTRRHGGGLPEPTEW